MGIAVKIVKNSLTARCPPKTLEYKLEQCFKTHMQINRITAALLMLTLIAPTVPAYSDCGCGGNSHNADDSQTLDTIEVQAACCKPTPSDSCCSENVAEQPVGCCGNTGDACECSASGCQCGDDCRCVQATEPPFEEPRVPSSDSELTNVLTQLGHSLAGPHSFDTPISSLQTQLDTHVYIACFSSSERCSRLCRFLR